MAGLDVTLLTEPWFEDLKELFMVRAVGLVAVGAALRHRRMLPQEGTPLLWMAAIAVVIDGVGLEELFGDRAVGIVAACAGHLPLAEGHVGGTHELCPALDVALSTGLDLGGLGELTPLGDVLHDPMAVGASQVPQLMGTALPVETGGLLMALQTDRIALRDRRGVLLRKGDQPLESCAPRLHVGLARAVAALAAEGLLSVSRVLEKEFTHGGGGELLEWLDVAGFAGLSPHIARRKGCWGPLGGRLDLTLQGRRAYQDCHPHEGWNQRCEEKSPAGVSHAKPSTEFANMP